MTDNGKARAFIHKVAATAAEQAIAQLGAGITGRLDQLEEDVAELTDATIGRRTRRPANAPARDPLRRPIIATLAAAKRPLTGTEIEQAIGRPPKDDSTRRVLRELAVVGVAERCERGWRLIERDDGRCPCCGAAPREGGRSESLARKAPTSARNSPRAPTSAKSGGPTAETGRKQEPPTGRGEV